VAPLNDPTLLFANAGMNQFKPVFLGQVDPQSNMAKLKRAANSQKCIRAGGKHNDLDDVGRDTYHHTFFEMLGTWSFGDYFKEEAIDWAWTLLTDVYKLDPDRLYATYFRGDDALPTDTEARDLWLRYLPESRVIGCDAKDNFWEMGDVGPCGPCSEVHYDRVGGGRDAASLVNADDPDVIEIWNIVFIQYNRDVPDGSLQLLPNKHIDTGMGLERLASLLQNKSSNYDIDAFQPIFRAIERHSKLGPYTGKVVHGSGGSGGGQEEEEDRDVQKDTAYRVLADHARTLTFAIADGAVPSNEGRGYVLRRILRRAIRYGRQVLGAEPGFMKTLVPSVVDTFGGFYPELRRAQDAVEEILDEEERAFSTMLERGIKFFDEMTEEIRASDDDKKQMISGSKAFYLYDTLGFPIDLTQLMAEEAGLTVDSDGFEREMEAQKERSRAAQRAARMGEFGADGAPNLELQAEQTAWLSDNHVLPTDDSFKYEWDVDLPATVLAVYGGSEIGFFQDESAEAKEGDYVGLILDKSPFYAEAGGQEADQGVIEILDEAGMKVVGTFAVTDVQVYAGFVLHIGIVEEGPGIGVGKAVNCKVDYDRRRLIAPNHSMTHVLNAALVKVLGDGVDQRGSLCNGDKLRFDFSYKKAMSAKQLKAVEEFCQQAIADAQPVTSQVLPLEEAKAIDGVRAVFGEVYPDPVRVVNIGEATSIEFCGGTHLSNTAEAEAFALIEETAVAKGIRRITAVTKGAAKQALEQGAVFESRVSELETLDAESTPDLDKQAGNVRKELDAAILSASLKAQLRARIEGVQKTASDAKKKALQKRVDTVLNGIKKDVAAAVADERRAVVLNVDIGADSKASQRVMNTVKSEAPELAFMGVSEEEPGSGGKVLAFAFVPDSLVESTGLKANEWIEASLEKVGGRGGGKPGNAQGQAKECPDVAAIIAAANHFADAKVVEAKV